MTASPPMPSSKTVNISWMLPLAVQRPHSRRGPPQPAWHPLLPPSRHPCPRHHTQYIEYENYPLQNGQIHFSQTKYCITVFLVSDKLETPINTMKFWLFIFRWSRRPSQSWGYSLFTVWKISVAIPKVLIQGFQNLPSETKLNFQFIYAQTIDWNFISEWFKKQKLF